jgi:putative peptidoglycan lipid II flippase
VLSAWCLGILNSHRKFFLSYTAPVIWNAAMIAALIGFGSRMPQFPLAIVLAWAAVIGSALQVGVQWPVVMHLLGRLRLALNYERENVRIVVRNFFPVFISRGVVQISAYVDSLIASLLPTGAVAALSYAQTLYTLPVSLFGMAVSAAELPAMSGQLGGEEEVARALRQRLDAGLRQIAYFVVPSVVAFLALGDVVVAAIYQSGRFTHADVIYVWGILAGSTVGLLASTLGRLYSATYYALRDTRTPLKFSIIRIALTTILGYLSAIPLPPLLGIAPRWGVAGLTISAGISGWVEFLLLRHYLNKRIGRTGLSVGFAGTLWSLAVGAAAVGWTIRWAIGARPPILTAAAVLLPYGIIYIGGTMLLKLPEAKSFGALFARFSSRS